MFDTTYKKIGLILGQTVSIYFLILYAGTIVSLILPLIIALLISRKLRSLIKWLNDHLPIPMSIISLLSVIIAISIVSLILTGIGQLIILGASQLTTVLPLAIDELNTFYETVMASYHNYFNLLPPNWQNLAQNGVESLISQLGAFAATIATSLVNSLSFLPNIIFFSVFTLLTTYFVTRDYEKADHILQEIYSFLESKALYHEIKKNVFMVVIGYLKAQLILMSITFLISIIGLNILKVQYAPLIALVIALIDALPMLGPAIVYMPWIIGRTIIGNFSGAIALGVLYLVATLTRQTLEPKIMSTQIGVHPILTLSSMYAGIKLFGFLGIILGPLSTIIILKSYKTLTLTEKHEH